MICRGARAQFLKQRWMKFWHAPFSFTSRPSVINIFHAKHASGGSQAIKVKVYSPSTRNHTPRLVWNNGCCPTINIPGGVCLNYLRFCFWSFDHRTGHPSYQPFSREWWAESTHLENNPPSMEDIDNPSWYMSYSSIQNRISFEGLEFGTYKFTWNGR